jgi:two-component system chemotaxis response regulator CheB
VSRLPEILNFQGSLRATHPRDGEAIQSGHVYVAPPDRHLLLDTGCVRVVRGPKENGFRPAVDPLFRSAALAYGPRVIGVVLTGALDDGAAGLWAVKRWGGMAVVQDPREAKFASMPANALEYVQVDYCLPIAEVGSLLSRAAGEPAPEMDLNESATRRTEAAAYLALMTNGVSSARGKETVNNETVDNEITEKRRMKTTVGVAATENSQGGTLSGYVCPECNGPLWEVYEGKLLRFRCRVGHAFSRDAMLAMQSEALDQSLWTAYETLCESALLAERFAAESRGRGQEVLAAQLEERARVQRLRAERMRAIIADGDTLTSTDGPTNEHTPALGSSITP